jgi:Tol biopolymer transport system component
VLRLIRQHKTNSAIAAELGLSLNTVKFHVANMLAKLELPDRDALANWKDGGTKSLGRRFLGWPALGAGFAVATGAVTLAVLVALTTRGTDDEGAVVRLTPPAGSVAQGPTPTPIPAGSPVGQLAFVGSSADVQETQLFVLPATGGTPAVLTNAPGARFSPVWSPDGTEIAYLEVPLERLPIVAGESSVASLRVVEPKSGNLLILKDGDVSVRPAGAVLERPAWRPDGQRLVVAVRDFITSRVNVDGTDYREERLGCRTPSWSPDGLYGSCSVSGGEGTFNRTIWLHAVSPEFRTSGYGGERVTSGWSENFGGRGLPAHGLVNSASTWFAWWVYDATPRPMVLVAPLDTTKASDRGGPREAGPGMEPRWAPDGTRLLFSTASDLSFPQRLSPADLVVYDAEAGTSRILISGGANRWPVWSPDGRHIAFVSDRDDARGELYVMRADGSEVTRLTFNELSESMIDWGR